jgi:RNA-binding protein
MDLTGSQRRYLRGLAHHLNPVVIVGGAGVSDAIVTKVAEELEYHEIIKVKVSRDAPETAKEAGAALADKCGAHVAQVIGHMCVLYKARANKPSIKLPRSSG